MTRLLIALSVLFCSFGCAVHMDLPDRFLELGRDGTGLQATSSDNSLIWVRTFGSGVEEDGSLDFWITALRRNLEDRGYQVSNEEDIEAASLRGKALTLTGSAQGRTHKEWVAVFVRNNWGSGQTICTVELVAPDQQFTRDLPAVRQQIQSLRF